MKKAPNRAEIAGLWLCLVTVALQLAAQETESAMMTTAVFAAFWAWLVLR